MAEALCDVSRHFFVQNQHCSVFSILGDIRNHFRPPLLTALRGLKLRCVYAAPHLQLSKHNRLHTPIPGSGTPACGTPTVNLSNDPAIHTRHQPRPAPAFMPSGHERGATIFAHFHQGSHYLFVPDLFFEHVVPSHTEQGTPPHSFLA